MAEILTDSEVSEIEAALQGFKSRRPQLVHTARVMFETRLAKYNDPRNEEWNLDDITDKWERHAWSAYLDLIETEKIAGNIPRLIESHRALAAERDRLRREYDEEVDEFNAGFQAYKDSLPEDTPHDEHHDVWLCGYAWAAYADLKAQVHLLAEEKQAEHTLSVMYKAMRESAEKECDELRAEVAGKTKVIEELIAAAKSYEDQAAALTEERQQWLNWADALTGNQNYLASKMRQGITERIRTLESACEAARKLFVGLMPELDRAEDVEAIIKRPGETIKHD